MHSYRVPIYLSPFAAAPSPAPLRHSWRRHDLCGTADPGADMLRSLQLFQVNPKTRYTSCAIVDPAET
ncbi:MAG: hypothetical protein J7459_14380, partial [Chloroflexus sp.]|nr:hypothetical protein [Chloroflexus sp.]